MTMQEKPAKLSPIEKVRAGWHLTKKEQKQLTRQEVAELIKSGRTPEQDAELRRDMKEAPGINWVVRGWWLDGEMPAEEYLRLTSAEKENQ